MNRISFVGLFAALSLCLLPPQNLSGQEALLTINGFPGEYDLGRVCEPIGDFNNDGKSNVLISSTAVGTPPQQILRVFDDAGNVLLSHVLNLNEYTSDLVALGDVNGDGTVDFAYNTSITSSGGILGVSTTSNGDVVVVSGATGSEIRRHTQLLSSGSPVSSGTFGTEIDRAGDINGDGIMDLLVADPRGSSNGLTNNGVVYVHSGADGSLIYQIDGIYSSIEIGTSISELGDVTGDSIPDFLVGLDPILALPTSSQTAYVISGATGTIVTSYSMPVAPSTNLVPASFELRGNGDIDNDGTNDIIMALATDSSGGVNAGLIRVISGATGNVIQDFVGVPCQGVGDSISMADVNADGYADIVTGNFVDTHTLQNETTVISGLTYETMINSAVSAIDVTNTNVAGDFNGDGFEDFMLTHWAASASGSHKVVIVSGGPALGSTAKTKVGTSIGQPQDVLKVNGDTGGQLHCVGCGLGESITMSVDQPAMNMVPADFVIFGRVGVPMGDETYVVPGVNGDMAVIPAPMVTWAIPQVFTLVSSVGPMPGGQIFLSGPAPWGYTMSGGLNFPMEFTLEGVIMEDATTASKTNAVIVRVH